MKKITILTTLILFSFIPAKACEICGCGLGNYYIGMMPQFTHAFLGIRYQFQHFKTVMADDPSQFSQDHYKTIELRGGWNFGRKWQLIATLPYHFVHQVSDDGIKNNQGIGDIAAMLNYKIFDRMSAFKKNTAIIQQLWFGAGIKIPTGRFNIDATDPALVAIANTQTGTASTDFMLNTMYNIRISNIGINSSASYKINTTNKDKYGFGNKFSANSILYYAVKKRNIDLMPNIGINYEHTASSTLYKKTVAQTGGYLLATAAGLEASFKKITVGTNIELPLSQNFANGQTNMKLKGMMHISFSF